MCVWLLSLQGTAMRCDRRADFQIRPFFCLVQDEAVDRAWTDLEVHPTGSVLC